MSPEALRALQKGVASLKAGGEEGWCQGGYVYAAVRANTIRRCVMGHMGVRKSPEFAAISSLIANEIQSAFENEYNHEMIIAFNDAHTYAEVCERMDDFLLRVTPVPATDFGLVAPV